ncbi:glycosyltransferase [Algoriphagus namhaensis]
MKKIKILHLIKSLGRGGAEKLIPQTAQVHDQQRFEFHCLYFFHQENNIVDELEAAGIQVHLFPSSNFGLFFQVKKVQQYVDQEEFDIIHAHLPWAGILSRLIRPKAKVRIVYTEHNTWDRYNKFSYWGNRLSFKHQDAVIAVSNEVALSMRLNSIWDPYQRGGRMKLRVIQNGVNTDLFQRIDPSDQEIQGIREQLNIPSEAPVIGKVAVFRSQKRLWLWVEIALKILESCPETHFILVGDGEWRARILKQIQASGKSGHFHWVGVQKNVVPYLSLMDIYLSSSEFEGLPIAMLEAMSCEVAVVATRAGGIGEVISHGKEGYLTAIENWAELANHAIHLIQNPKKLSEMKKLARKRVIEEFSMHKMVRELEAVYREVKA